MSLYPPTSRCPRCQNPVAPGATTCGTCGLVLPGAAASPPGGNPLYPLPTIQPPAGPSYGTPPVESFGTPGGSGGYPASNQPPTYYSQPGQVNSAPTVASSLYPQDQAPPAAPSYPGSQSPGGWGSQPAYPGNQPPGGYSGSQPAYPGSSPAYPGSQPQGGFNAGPPTFAVPPPTYPGSQPQGGFNVGGGFPGAAPAYPGSQPQAGFVGGPFAPPGVITPPQQPSTGKGLKILLIVLVALIVLGGAGTAVALILANQPKPTITVIFPKQTDSSKPMFYCAQSGSQTPACAAEATLLVSGNDFSSNSAITFLLNGANAPEAPAVTSDDKGNFSSAPLKVMSDWAMGTLTLTAKDAKDHATPGVSVKIVAQGEAGTPGPKGAPSDTDNFMLTLTVHYQDAVTGEQFQDYQDTLTVNGQGAPAVVCDTRLDDSQPHDFPGQTSSGVKFTDTLIFQCSGSYKGGQFTYKETVTSFRRVFANGIICTAQTPFINQNIVGSFSDATNVSGSYNGDSITFNCTTGTTQVQQTINPQKGTIMGSK